MTKRISPEMRRVLMKLRRADSTAERMGCSITTLIALERRGLIAVETSIQAIGFPRRALAWIRPDGRRAILERAGA